MTESIQQVVLTKNAAKGDCESFRLLNIYKLAEIREYPYLDGGRVSRKT